MGWEEKSRQRMGVGQLIALTLAPARGLPFDPRSRSWCAHSRRKRHRRQRRELTTLMLAPLSARTARIMLQSGTPARAMRCCGAIGLTFANSHSSKASKPLVS
eukprot:73289-Chlamydomonas_euryale.AAC.3